MQVEIFKLCGACSALAELCVVDTLNLAPMPLENYNVFLSIIIFGSERSLRGADVVSLSVGLWVGGFVGGSLLCSTALLKGF